MGATFFNDKTGEVKTVENYNGATWWTDQDIDVANNNFDMSAATLGPTRTATGPGGANFDFSSSC